MHGGSKKVQREKKYSTFKSIESVHPHKMILYIALFGNLLIFGFMIFGFIYSSPKIELYRSIEFPKIFTLGLIILLYSNYEINKIIDFYSSDQLNKFKNQWAISLILALFLGVCQFIGWSQLRSLEIIQQADGSLSFLIVIMIFQGIQIISGIVIIITYFVKSWHLSRDPVKNLIFMTNPHEKVKLEMLTTFWRTMNIYWIGVFIILLYLF